MRTPHIIGIMLALAAVAVALAPSSQNEVDDAVAKLYASVRAHDDPGTYKAAAVVVAFGEAAIPHLTASLDARTPAEIVWCLRCLKEIKSAAAKDAALALCSHAQAEVRAEAAVTAAALAGEGAVATLIRMTVDPDALVRRRAFDSILDTGTICPEVVPVATRGVLDADAWIVVVAVQILDRIPRPLDAAQDPVLAAVAGAIGRLDERNAAATFDLLVRRTGIQCGPLLLKALDSRRSEVVVAALDAAGRVRLVSAGQRITKLAKGTDRRVAKAAVECLATINEPSSVPVLVDILEASRDAEMIDAVAVALRKMTGLLLGTDVAAWRKYLAERTAGTPK